MGPIFRRRIMNVPAVKFNLSKNGASTTFETKGGVQENSTPPKKPQKKRAKGCLTLILILFVLGGIGSIFANNDKPKSITLSADTSLSHDVNKAIPIVLTSDPADVDMGSLKCESSGGTVKKDGKKLSFIAKEPGSYDVHVTIGDIKSNTIKIAIEDKAAIAEAAAQKAEAEKLAAEAAAQKAEADRLAAEVAAQQKAEADRLAAEVAAQQKAEADAAALTATQSNQQPQEQMVWLSATGEKYHNNSSCGKMNPATSYQITLSEAQATGYEACKKCY